MGMEERSADPVLQRRQHGHGASSGKRQMIKVTVQPGGHQIKLRIWSSTLEVKQQMGARLGGHVSWMRLLHNNVELLNSQLLIDLVPNVKPPRRGPRDSSGGAANPSRSLTFWLKVRLSRSSTLRAARPTTDTARPPLPPPPHPAGAKPARFRLGLLPAHVGDWHERGGRGGRAAADERAAGAADRPRAAALPRGQRRHLPAARHAEAAGDPNTLTLTLSLTLTPDPNPNPDPSPNPEPEPEPGPNQGRGLQAA